MNEIQVDSVLLDKSNSSFDAVITLESLALQRGVAPVADPSTLFGDFWPEEESTDDFLRTLRSWRQDNADTEAR